MSVSVTKNDLDTMEAMVDKYSLSGVVESLAHIANEKGDHLRTNWQDNETAKEWERAAAALDKTAARILL